ncbi:uncharacterized protein LOC133530233 [Cydia pomonella]|uniref:uncharacterized protein LOC133530233 n=1 Tax=Cydia pomonella TaxID=82600 RepID=UPI002ADE6BAC|nr:uncharacterized protein LOC133530233 [Cydia pomonella]
MCLPDRKESLSIANVASAEIADTRSIKQMIRLTSFVIYLFSLHQLSSSNSQVSSLDYLSPVHTPARRIYRGHKTKIKHFPFLVTVHVLGRFVCGGTIIKSDLVITAAHCLKRWQEWVHRTSTTLETTTYETTTDETTTDTITTDVISIDDIVNDVFGIDVIATGTDGAEFKSTNTNTDGTETTPTETETTDTTIITQQISSEDSGKSSSYETIPPKTVITEETSKPPTFGVLSVRIGTNYYRLEGKVVQVVNVYFHPSYDENNLQDNLVIMRLERHLNFKRRRVRKIEISTDASDVAEGTEVTIAGWGAKTYHNKVFNALWNLIHKAVLTVSPRDECVDTYTENFVTTTNFCALNEHHEGACNRDAGNPAVVDGLLVGVVSFGPPNCGQWDAPTVFTNVGYYADWIEEIMHMDLKSSSISSSSSDENENRKKPTPETTTKCAGWTKATTTPELSEFDTPVYYDGNIYKDEKGWTTKATTTTELSGFDTPVYYDGNIYKDEKEQYNFPTRAYEDVKLRRRFSVVVSEKHSTSIVPLDNALPKISTLSESGATIEKIFLLTPNTPRIRNDLDHTVPIFPYIFERFS